MINRIELILKTQNLTPTQFADAIGIQRSSLSHILSRRNNPSLDFVTKLLTRFPEISSEWILTGKGQMLKLGTFLPSGTSPELSSELPSETTLPDAKSPEFEWNNLDEAPRAAESQLAPSQPQEALPPPSTPTGSGQIKIPPVDKRDNSDIERIIVFFTDGTFRSYS